MTAAAIASALLSREVQARRELRAHLRAVSHSRVDPEDSDAVADIADQLGDRFARTVRDTSDGAGRDGIAQAAADAKAAIGGAALAFLVLSPLRWRQEDDAVTKFALARQEHAREAVSSAFVSKVRLHGDLATAAGSLKSRADTYAASESAMGIGWGYTTTAAEIVKGTGADSRLLVLEWVAVLDRRTCEVCAAFDGHTTEVGGDFGGEMPGFVHARCRCFAWLRRA